MLIASGGTGSVSQMERREAPPRLQPGRNASQAFRRADRKARQGGLANPLAPPGAPPPLGGKEKGPVPAEAGNNGVAHAATTGPAELCVMLRCERSEPRSMTRPHPSRPVLRTGTSGWRLRSGCLKCKSDFFFMAGLVPAIPIRDALPS